MIRKEISASQDANNSARSIYVTAATLSRTIITRELKVL